jgi:hypothetical protein
VDTLNIVFGGEKTNLAIAPTRLTAVRSFSPLDPRAGRTVLLAMESAMSSFDAAARKPAHIFQSAGNKCAYLRKQTEGIRNSLPNGWSRMIKQRYKHLESSFLKIGAREECCVESGKKVCEQFNGPKKRILRSCVLLHRHPKNQHRYQQIRHAGF